MNPPSPTRRDLLLATGGIALGTPAVSAVAEPPAKVYRVGVISAAKQPRNGHNWHFAQYLHPTCDFDALKKHYPQGEPSFRNVFRNPRFNFDQLPFPDTKITHYYDADPKLAVPFAESFPGVKVATNLEKMVQEVDAVW